MCPRLPRLAALTRGALAALAVLVAAPTAAEPVATGLATSRTHVLRVRPRVAAGLEAGMPRTSAYAQGVALDLQERFEPAASRFRDAEIEFSRMKPPAGGPAVLEAWRRKARWQSYWSQQLGLRHRGYRPWGGIATGDLGHGYYMKFLAARAFTGHAPLGLAAKARTLLETTVRTEPDNVFARLSLAALLHEIGEPALAQREYHRIALTASQRQDAMLILRLAAYFVAAGDHERALASLERALQRPYMYRSLREMMDWSNEFDRLRDDPRFRRLMEKDPAPGWPRGPARPILPRPIPPRPYHP
jgi:tetratricopeptide (TPR) repeat protein